jgi:glyoxylase-like metal-dependent hydrolase (beta-lactamase superfamily II)
MAQSMLGNACFTIDADPAHPEFVASYLRVAGDECAFIDTNTAHSVPLLLDALAAHGLSPHAVRYVIVTHAHLDHAGGAGKLMEACPDALLVAHPRAARHLIDPTRLVASAKQVYGAERFASLFGDLTPVAPTRVLLLEDEADFMLGTSRLRALHTRGHAKHHLVVHDPALDTVFTGDAFGLCYPKLQRPATFALPSTSPTDFEPDEARKSIARIVGLGAWAARLTHFGPATDVLGMAAQLVRYLDQAEALLEDALHSDAPVAQLEAQFREKIRWAVEVQATEVGLTLGPDEWALLALDVELNAQGMAFVADRQRGATSA